MPNLQVKRNCHNCGKERMVKRSVLKKRSRGIFCSTSCTSKFYWKDKAYAEHMKEIHSTGRKWKGSMSKYRDLHSWVVKELGQPNSCSRCGKEGTGRKMHWANKSHEYKKELSDWIRLCVPCHKAYDLDKITV